MKKIICLSVLFCAFCFLNAQNANMMIEAKIQNNDFDGNIIWYIKGDKLAFDMIYTYEGNTYETRFIPQPDKGVMYLLNDAGGQKMKTTINAGDIRADENFDKRILEVNIEENVVVSGIECKKIIVKTANTVTECFIDTSIDFPYYRYEAFLRSDYALLALRQLNMKGFPIAVKTTDRSGNVINNVETLNIRSNVVSDNIFTVTADYKSFEEINKEYIERE